MLGFRKTFSNRGVQSNITYAIRTQVPITAVGNAQISTAQKKFGTGSLRCDGNGDVIYSNDILASGTTGNFTIELWFRLDSTARDQYLINNRWSGSYVSGDFTIYHSSANARIQIASPNWTQININASGNYTTNTWYHLALVRNGTTLTAYLEGVSKGTATSSASIFATNKKLIIGSFNETGAGTDSMLGYIDEVRVSNSARYTADFTPSTTAFVNDSNTLFLLHADGTNGSQTFVDDYV